jgi:hypothetical protein
MDTSWLGTLFDLIANFIGTMGDLISGVLRLDPDVFRVALTTPYTGLLALLTLFLAGISDTIGHSVVLFANRVPRRRFIFSIVTEALILVAGVFFWAATIWFTADVVFRAYQPYTTVLTAVALGYAPLLFGFLILLPYLGNFIFIVSRIWVLLAVLVGVAVAYSFGTWQTIICSVLGWMLLTLLTRLPFLRIKRIDNWLWQFSTGTPQEMDTEEVVAQFLREVRADSANGSSS